MIISTILELIAVIFLIIGFINEDKIINFEDRIITKIKKWFKSV